MTQSQATFASNGRRVTVDKFEPDDHKRHPAILFIHGSDGMVTSAWKFAWSRDFAAHGYVVFIPHYFEAIGPTTGDHSVPRRNFVIYLQALADAADFAAVQNSVDPGRLGIMGYSLGASLSLALAARDNKLKAVVEFFGGMPFGASHFTHMPPTLILHGAADPVVPVQRAYDLETLLKERNVPYEIKIYPGQGHGFLDDADRDSRQRTAKFFDRHLRP